MTPGGGRVGGGAAAPLTHGGVVAPLKNRDKTAKPHKSEATGLRNELYGGKKGMRAKR